MADVHSDNPDSAAHDKPTNRMETAERRARVVDMHHAGQTFQQIGDEIGVTRQRAHEIYWEAIDAIPARSVGAVRTAQGELLTEVIRVAAEVMANEHLAHSNGRLVKNVDGSPVLDDGPKLDAGRTIVSASARLSKMFGTDAPTRVEASVTEHVDPETIELRRLILQQQELNLAARAALEGGRP